MSPIDRALQLPNGARFYRCALQVNPHGYEAKFRGQANALTGDEYVQAIMAKCVELRIEAIALTDHGSAASFERFRDAGKRHGVTVFPGFELTSSEGIHVLCIYDPRTDPKKLDRWLGALGADDTQPSSAPSKYPFRQILEKVRQQTGVAIAAHVTLNYGLFKTLNGQARIDAWCDPNLRAVQIPGAVDGVPNTNDWRSILRNRNPDYRRERPAGEDLAVAVVNACDVTQPADLEKPGASCWIKMSEVSAEGLRQAFLDPDSRIRLAGDERWQDHAEVLAVTWEGGFLNGAAVHFSGNLNVLIGGRGTGKSTVLESLRYALGLDPAGDDARRQHESVVRNVLGNGTKVTVHVCSRHPTRMDYRIERTVPNPPVVRDRNGSVLNVRPADLMPRTEIYGQHEIAELARSPEKLTRLLARFVPQDGALPERAAAAQRELERSRAQLAEARDELQRVDERLAALPAVEETLRKYQEAGVEVRLQDQSLVVREERVLRSAAERLQPARGLIGALRQAADVDVAFLSERALEGLPGKPLLRDLEPALAEVSADIAGAADQLEAALRRVDAVVAAVRARWEVRRQAAQAEYERVLRELQKDRVDGQEFIRLRGQLEELRPLAERRALLVRAVGAYDERRRALVAEWEEVKAQEYRQLDVAAKKVNSALAGRVRVRVHFGGDRKALGELLRNRVGGTLAQTIKTLEADNALSLPELATLYRGQPDALARKYGIPRGQAERLAEQGDGLAMRIEELRLPPTTTLELNVAVESHAEEWRALDDLSTGQKATAVLLLLLLESDAPLMVDQPEDDLDNRFIADGIIPTMRREKRRRQFIVTTHNANIPVLGDAELIAGLATRAVDGRVQAETSANLMGSIDTPAVRALVEELLEGGKAAFELRRLKYHF